MYDKNTCFAMADSSVIGPLMNKFTGEPELWHILGPCKKQH